MVVAVPLNWNRRGQIESQRSDRIGHGQRRLGSARFAALGVVGDPSVPRWGMARLRDDVCRRPERRKTEAAVGEAGASEGTEHTAILPEKLCPTPEKHILPPWMKSKHGV